MHRIDTPTAQIDKFGAGKNGFTGGNPQSGEPATALDAEFFDSVQEEIATFIENAGVALDKTVNNQLLLAAQKLLLSRKNPFADIKADGAAALASALSNLGLGTAAKKDVGNGSGQLPDMSLFPFSNADYGYFKLPNGIIFQWRTLTIGPATSPNMRTSSAGWAINFPNAVLAAVCSLANVTTYGTDKQGFVSSTVTTSGFTLGSGYTASNSTVTIFAIGY